MGLSALATEEERIQAMQSSERQWAAANYSTLRRGRGGPAIPTADYRCNKCGQKGACGVAHGRGAAARKPS